MASEWIKNNCVEKLVKHYFERSLAHITKHMHNETVIFCVNDAFDTSDDIFRFQRSHYIYICAELNNVKYDFNYLNNPVIRKTFESLVFDGIVKRLKNFFENARFEYEFGDLFCKICL